MFQNEVFQIGLNIMKCGKVKNPCKICFQSVSNKNGLQCKGACKKWAHFKCLDYTPGKISDIKAGLIKVTCPCPDCNTGEPKEALTKPPFTCTKEECPANKLTTCEFPDCPKKQNPIPPPILTLPRSGSAKDIPTEQKSPSSPQKLPSPSPQNISRRVPSPPRKSHQSSPTKASQSTSPGVPRSPASPPVDKTAARPHARAPCPSCPTYCPKVNSNKKLATDAFISPQRSLSCSFDSEKSDTSTPRSCSSDSALSNAHDQKILCSAIEEMCDTMGQLSNQLKDFMCKMLNTFQKSKQRSN